MQEATNGRPRAAGQRSLVRLPPREECSRKNWKSQLTQREAISLRPGI